MLTTVDNLEARGDTDIAVGNALAGSICAHCGAPCLNAAFRSGEAIFCCRVAGTVFELLTENGLDQFYQLNERAGVKVSAKPLPGRFGVPG